MKSSQETPKTGHSTTINWALPKCPVSTPSAQLSAQFQANRALLIPSINTPSPLYGVPSSAQFFHHHHLLFQKEAFPPKSDKSKTNFQKLGTWHSTPHSGPVDN